MQPSHHNKMLCEPDSNLNPEMERCQWILFAQAVHFFEAAYQNRILEALKRTICAWGAL